MKQIGALSSSQEGHEIVEYSANSVAKFIKENDFEILKIKDRGEYYNTVAAFDIETSSWYFGDTPFACLVCWQFGIKNTVFIGRTWEELSECIETLRKCMGLGPSLALPVYVHNLAYEFGWIHKRLEFFDVFATDIRKPIKARCAEGIEFRDSLILSQKTLEKLGEDLYDNITRKLNTWDYNKIRHSKTPLTPEEIEYAANDVFILMEYIRQEKEENGNIENIPMTKTGYVRRLARGRTIYGGNGKKYKKLMDLLRVSPEEYKKLKNAFRGGLVRANRKYIDKMLGGCSSFDFTSSYPSVLVCEKFPMGIFMDNVKPKNEEQLEKWMEKYCCLMSVEFKNINAKNDDILIINEDGCEIKGVPEINDGFIVGADFLKITITEQDFYNIRDFYDWDGIEFKGITLYNKGYLPTELISLILELYNKKTLLKGVRGKEVEYRIAKEMLNSIFGMMVTDIVQNKILYKNGKWKPQAVNFSDAVNRYSGSLSRFLYYPWGVWCTAYARRNLCRGIIAAGDSFVYCDTDSIKYIRELSDFEKWAEEYNKELDGKMTEAMKFHGLDFELTRPMGKALGHWDHDGEYIEFKTLGAKRYAYTTTEKNDDGVDLGGVYFVTTLAGSIKKKTAEYIAHKGGNVFDSFAVGLEIPADKSGKLAHTYIEKEISGEVTDYLGNVAEFHELSCVHLWPVSFKIEQLSDLEMALRSLGL